MRIWSLVTPIRSYYGLVPCADLPFVPVGDLLRIEGVCGPKFIFPITKRKDIPVVRVIA